MSTTWFITGASRGFGREWATAALERGDSVAATARDTATLDDLVQRFGDAVLPLQLDVTDREADIAAVHRAHDTFGRLDVVVNNAGYGLFGMVEEVSEAEVRAQFDANVFGALWITQAALPLMRAQGSGHVLQVSSVGGIVALPNLGIYNASKWALEAFSQSLAAEVAQVGDPLGPRPRLRRVPGEGHGRPGQGRPVRRGPRRHRRRRPPAGRRRRAAAAGLLRQGAAGHGHQGVRAAAGHLAGVGAAVDRRARRLIAATTWHRPVLRSRP
jgi:hypothetical protein